jgi:hypothetical protein
MQVSRANEFLVIHSTREVSGASVHLIKELAKAAMNESGNDVLKAYDLLCEKIGAAKG